MYCVFVVVFVLLYDFIFVSIYHSFLFCCFWMNLNYKHRNETKHLSNFVYCNQSEAAAQYDNIITVCKINVFVFWVFLFLCQLVKQMKLHGCSLQTLNFWWIQLHETIAREWNRKIIISEWRKSKITHNVTVRVNRLLRWRKKSSLL